MGCEGILCFLVPHFGGRATQFSEIFCFKAIGWPAPHEQITYKQQNTPILGGFTILCIILRNQFTQNIFTLFLEQLWPSLLKLITAKLGEEEASFYMEARQGLSQCP